MVATEVRSLAGRSAEAAEEIKSLFSASVKRVEQGTALVDKAGNTIAEVVDSIKRVADIMGEISAASRLKSQSGDLVQTVAAFKPDESNQIMRPNVRSMAPANTPFSGGERRASAAPAKTAPAAAGSSKSTADDESRETF